MTQNNVDDSPWAYDNQGPVQEGAYPAPPAEPPAEPGRPADSAGRGDQAGPDETSVLIDQAELRDQLGQPAYQPDRPIFGAARTGAIPPSGTGSEPADLQPSPLAEPLGRHSQSGSGFSGADGYKDVHYYAHPDQDPALSNGSAPPQAADPAHADDPAYAAHPAYAADPLDTDPAPSGGYPSAEFGSPFGLPPQAPAEPPVGISCRRYRGPSRSAAYAQPSYGQPSYGQPSYGQPPLSAQPPYGQPPQYSPTPP